MSNHYNPYTNLKHRFKEFVDQISALKNYGVFYFGETTPPLESLKNYAEAAEVHGAEVVMVVNKERDRVEFAYRKKIPQTPWL